MITTYAITITSIIIRTKNEERWIGHCLKSIFNQLKVNAEWFGVRKVRESNTYRMIRDGNPQANSTGISHGIMVEVLKNGQFAYAASSDMSTASIQKAIDSNPHLELAYVNLGSIKLDLDKLEEDMEIRNLNQGYIVDCSHGNSRKDYMNQPKVAQWNLARFAETLLTLIDKDINKSIELAEELINKFPEVYQEKWLNMMRSKLGLFQAHESDVQLISDLLDWMVDNNADYTNTFRSLSQLEKPNSELYKGEKLQNWYKRWQNRLRANSESIESSIDLMKSSNPAVIPRNHKVEEALEAANIGNLKPFEDLVSILKEPYTDRAALKAYKEPLKSGVADYKTFCGT